MTRALTNILSPSSERYFGMHPIDLMARVDFLLIISLMWLLSGKLLSIITPTFLAFFVMLISVPANVMLSPKALKVFPAICWLLLQMARMDTDCNLKKLGPTFKSFNAMLAKITKTNIMVSALWWNFSIIAFSVWVKAVKEITSAQNWSKTAISSWHGPKCGQGVKRFKAGGNWSY